MKESICYNVNDFTDEERELARVFIYKAVAGMISIKANEYSHNIMEKVQRFGSFYGDDKFEATITINTLGNDFLAALGAARMELSKDKEA